MSDKPLNYREASQADYRTGTPSAMGYIYAPTADQLKVGTMQRLADAAERIAGALGTGRIQLPTAIFPIQPRHADEFRTLVAEQVADRPGRLYIVAWHLLDEHTLHVTLAYERGESLIWLGRYWEAQRAEGLVAPADENADDANTWVLPLYCDSRDIERQISELEASPVEGEPAYMAGLLRRFLTQESLRRQLLINVGRSQGHA